MPTLAVQLCRERIWRRQVYLKDCFIENIGPIKSIDLSLPFQPNGIPQPIVLVGGNGSGKSILLSYVVDALTELAKQAFSDIVARQGQQPQGGSALEIGRAHV